MYREMGFNLFGGSSALMINKKMIECFGLLDAAYLAILIEENYWFCERNGTDIEDEFYYLEKEQIKELNISLKVLRYCRKRMKEIGILKTRKFGTPPKIYYSIDYEKIMEAMYGQKNIF